jgi:hypothetical protein
MIPILFAAAVATSEPPPDVELSCRGTSFYETGESATTIGPNNKVDTTSFSQSHADPQMARVHLSGASGELIYGSDRRRDLKNLTADPNAYTATYSRFIYQFRVRIDRHTGAIEVGRVGLFGVSTVYEGVCEKYDPQGAPKF